MGLLLYPLVLAQFVLAWYLREQAVAVAILLASAAVILVLAWSFKQLTIQDEGDYLGIAYGPLPIFYKRFAYDTIEAVERGRTKVIDGWGIHWVPGRGMTYNLWGFDCVNLTIRGKTVRLGTNDPDGLLAAVQEKLPS